MRELKVYGGMFIVDGVQVRGYVATRTKKRAIELLDLSPNYFNSYWGETGNEVEVYVAHNEPETVFYFPKGTEYNKRTPTRLRDGVVVMSQPPEPVSTAISREEVIKLLEENLRLSIEVSYGGLVVSLHLNKGPYDRITISKQSISIDTILQEHNRPW